MSFDDDVRDLYQEVILDHGRKPRHGHRLTAYDATAKGDNPMCGDRVEVWVKFAGDGTISETGFEAKGCAISVVPRTPLRSWTDSQTTNVSSTATNREQTTATELRDP